MRATRFRSLVLAAAILGSASPALGQEFRIGGGATLPLQPSEFTDLYSFGFHGGLEISAPVNKPKTTHLGVAAYHHRFPLDEGGAKDAAGVPPGTPLSLSGGTFLITEVFGLVRAELSENPTRVYLLAGLGIALQDATDLETTAGGQARSTSFDSETDALITLGLGVRHSFGAWALFGQARIAHVTSDDDDTDYVPITVGVAF